MERDLGEVLDSQEKMLRRLGQEAAPRDAITRAYTLHLDRLHRWLAEQAHIAVLRVGYAAVVAEPETEARRVKEFLGGRLNVAAAVGAIDPGLYRNRQAGARAGMPS
jgi:hypothetical protein